MKFEYLLLFILGINLLTYVLMYVDKRAAIRGHRRIPETSFYTLGLLLGAIGLLLGSRSFRHKTRKQPFHTIMYLLLLLNLVTLYFLP